MRIFRKTKILIIRKINKQITLSIIGGIVIVLISSTFSCLPIEFIQKEPNGKLHTQNQISLLTYNIEAISEKEEDQVNRFVEHLNTNNYDFVLLQELFSESTRDDIVEQLNSEHYSTIISRVDYGSFPEFLFQDSGLLMMSRFPRIDLSEIDFDGDIKSHDGIIYLLLEKEWSRTYDFLSNKSVIGSLFKISEDQKLFLITTHVQALGSTENKELQLIQIYEFIKTSITKFKESGLVNEADLSVVLAGDLNIDAYNNVWRENNVTYERLVSILGNPRDLHKEYNGNKREYTWNYNSTSYPRRFDYVFTYDSLSGNKFKNISTNNMKIVEITDSNNKSISDHRGISTELELNNSR